MKLNKPTIIKIIAIGIVLLILWHYWSLRHTHEHTASIPVKIATATLQPATVTVDTIGTIQAKNTVQIRSMVTGALLAANFTQGDTVKQSQLILTLDPKPSLAQIEEAKALLAKDSAQLANARITLARNSALKTKGFLSQQAYDDAQAAVTSLLAATQADQAALDTATLNLNYCYIKAPITGRTGSLLIQPGNLVKANDTNPIVVINQLDPIDVAFSLPETQLETLQNEMAKGPITVTVKTEHQAFDGSVYFIDNTVDITTGTIQLKAVVKNSQEKLWPGEFVHVIAPLIHFDQALLIPTMAIQERAEGHFVYLVDSATHKVHEQTITTKATVGDDTIVDSGLKSGDQVVTVGVLHLTDGATVTIEQTS